MTVVSGDQLEPLGRRFGESIGPSILDLEPTSPWVLAFHSALGGEQVSFTTEFEGHALNAVFAPQADATGAIVGVIGAVAIARSARGIATAGERSGTIVHEESAFGVLTDAADGDVKRPDLVGRRCYEAWGDGTPCHNCPVHPQNAHRNEAQRFVKIGAKWRIVDAAPASRATTHVRHAALPEALLSDLMDARVDTLAQEAELTAREREVLPLLLLGRSVPDIAMALGIAERTAKFHKVNALAKLGADSHFDLQRVVLLGRAPSLDHPRRRRGRRSA
jgi:DNA-binding NarL/FixJ family response regulator